MHETQNWIFLHEKKLGRVAQQGLSKNIHLWAQEGQATREPREDKQLGTQENINWCSQHDSHGKTELPNIQKNFHFQILLEVIWPKNEC